MIEWFRDPIWQFVGAVIALAAIGVSVWFFILQRNKKALAYEIVTYTPLVTVNKEAKDQIEIRFKGTPVANVYLIVMRVWNDGNVPILPGDFVEPLGFHLAEGTRILTAELVKTEPETLKPVLHPEGQTLGIAPLLLNGRDAFTVKLLVAGGEDEPAVKSSGRIAGVKAVMRMEPYAPIEPRDKSIRDSVIGLILTIVLVMLYAYDPLPQSTVFQWLLLAAAVMAGLFTVSSVIIYLLATRGKRYRPG